MLGLLSLCQSYICFFVHCYVPELLIMANYYHAENKFTCDLVLEVITLTTILGSEIHRMDKF